MSLITLQGTISNIFYGNEIRGSATTDNTWTFRVNNKPVFYRTKNNLNFSNNDKITAVGTDKKGTFNILCLRNETTGAVSETPAGNFFIYGGFLIIVGLPLSLVMIGLIPLGMGCYCIYMGRQSVKAAKILHSTPPNTQ